MPPTTPSVNNVWATTTPADAIETLTLPSGQVCKARRLGLENMIAAGLLGEADSLTALVGDKHVQRVREAKGNKVKEELTAQTMLKDPMALKRIMLLVDRATPHIVVEPRVESHVVVLETSPLQDSDLPKTAMVETREDGVVYTDQISLEDKMYLFNYAVGGTRDIERFREQSDAAVAGVADVEGAAPAPKRPTGGRGRRRR